MTHSRYRTMIEAASQRPALWRLFLGFITVFLGLLGWTALLIAVRTLVLGGTFVDTAADTLSLGESTPDKTVFYLLIVAGLGVGTAIAGRLWQKRGVSSMIGPGARTLRHAAVSAAVTFATLGLIALLTMPFSELPVRNVPVSTWVAWLPIAITALILQTGAEELLFRGYLQSQLAARLGRPAVAVVIPAILFGLAHYVAVLPLLSALGYVVIAAMFGVLAGDLTLRTGSIGAAWGFHFANNALAILVIAPGASLDGLALWTTGTDAPIAPLASPLATVEIAVLLLVWFLIRRALRV